MIYFDYNTCFIFVIWFTKKILELVFTITFIKVIEFIS